MSVFCRKDGRWVCKFPKGTVKDDPNRTSYYFCRGVVGEQQARKKNKELGLDKLSQHTGKTFHEIYNFFVESKIERMEDNSLDTVGVHVNKHLEPFFGNCAISEIDDDKVDQYVTHRRNIIWYHGKTRKVGVSRSTIRRELTTLQSMLNFAAKRKVISYNPIAFYDMPKSDDAILMPPTIEELQLIIKNSVPHLQRAIYLAYYTSTRPGKIELFSLKWEQVDFIRNVINIKSARKGGVEQRDVSLHPELRHLLVSWHEEDQKSKYNPQYIIHYCGKPIKKLDRAWRNAKKKSKILRRLDFYSIRHGSITAQLEAGADIKSVSLNAGHKNINTTMRIYQRATNKMRQAAINGITPLTPIDTSKESKTRL